MKQILYSLFALILLAAAQPVTAQSFALQGRVVDEKMNPIELVTVAIPSQGKATLTSLKGEFRLSLQSADSVVVRFSMIGYQTRTRILRHPRGKQTLQVVMHPSDNLLGEVSVTEMRRQTGQTQTLKKDANRMGPSASGNAVEDLIQSQAGVSTHNELSSQYNVRGGAFDENSVYINNVEVYRPFLVRSGQQEGLSIINPDLVERIDFSTGGYAAKYGDKMSSALDITYKRPTHFEASAAASLLGASAYLGLGSRNLSWSNALRYKTTRYLLGSLQTHGEYRPAFLDYQTYLSYTPNPRWQLDLIANVADNHYNFTPADRETRFGTMQNVRSFRVYFDGQEKDLFRTLFASLTLTRRFSPQASLSLIASAFHTRESETYDIQSQYWLTQTETSENLGVGTYFEHARNHLKAQVQSLQLMLNRKMQGHTLEAALCLKHERVEERSTEYEMRDSSGYSIPHTGGDLNLIYSLRAVNTLKARRTEAYLQDTYRFTSQHGHTHFTFNYGLRLSHWSFNGETILSPRLSLGIVPAFNRNITLRLATGLYYQAPFFKELRDTSTTAGITRATLNRNIKSQRSIHFIAAADYRFNLSGRPFKFTAEVYYKAMNHLVPYSVNNVKVVYYGQNLSRGHAAGVDLKLYGEFVPGTDSWINLSLMDTRMLLNGKTLPLPTDQRYAVNLFFTDYFPGTDRWKMSLRLAFADGLPFAAPHRQLENHSFRAPAYKRADIGMSYRLLNNETHAARSPFRNIWLGIDCLNLLGISNVNSYYWITDVTAQQYAVPNYLTGRQINAKLLFEF
ncbi:TonB-dependent receptor [Prevotella sp. oral taxon 475]|uniref:TonB-dependent receptor n=1 Tax=Prevotella sp. oral taxon 475 TaxID=712471 RepID=UPI001BA59D1D|nr:TonB-dependent receptor [Prevotella sp. oral taxon 475]QUB47922.1 TonB-dependent receptor [Prevotella sp. oral taxon 475]